MNTSRDDVQLCAQNLKEAGVCLVAPTHCTGRHAENIFNDVFEKNFIQLRENQTLSFDSQKDYQI